MGVSTWLVCAKLVLLNDCVKLVHRSVACYRDLLTKCIYHCRVDLRLLFHLLSQTLDVLLFPLKLFVLLLDHVLQGFDGLISGIRNLLRLFFMNCECLQTMVLNGIPEHLVLAQVLVSLLPLLQTAQFVQQVGLSAAVLRSLLSQPRILLMYLLLQSSNERVFFLQTFLYNPISATLSQLRMLPLDIFNARNGVLVTDPLCARLRKGTSTIDSPFNVFFDWTLTWELPVIVVEARLKEEFSLSLVVKLTISLLFLVHLSFKASGLLFQLEYGFVFVLYQSGHVGDTLLKLASFTLKPVLFESIVLKFLAQFNQASTLCVVVVIFKFVEKDLGLLSFGPSCVEGVLYLAELSSNLEVLFLKLSFVVSQVLNDSVQFLSLSLTYVDTLKLLNIVL